MKETEKTKSKYKTRLYAAFYRRFRAAAWTLVPISSAAACSQTPDHAANAAISFARGIQEEAFGKINGNSMATTMCIGNLRSATQNLDEYFYTKEKTYFKKEIL